MIGKAKKVLTMLILSLFLVSVTVPSFATEQPQFELTSAYGEVGGVVDVRLNINNNPGITALCVEIAYSEADLELVEIVNAGLFEDSISTGKPDTNPMKMSWYASDSENKTENGTLAVIKFRIREGAKASEVTLTYNPENVFDNRLENKEFGVANGKVYIGEDPSSETTEPSSETTEPSSETTEPSSETTEPSSETTEPSSETTEPSSETTEPSSETTEPSSETTEPSSETTEPSSQTEPTPVYKFGDVNLDGDVNVKDATLIQQIVVETAGLNVNDVQRQLADVDGDGTITVKDATELQKIIVNS